MQSKARNPGNTVAATNLGIGLLLTSNELWQRWTQNWKCFNYGYYAYQTKARNPGNTEAAKNSVSLEVIRYFLKKAPFSGVQPKNWKIWTKN